MNQRRRRPQRSVSGWLIFDKPYGMGSTDAVSLVKRLYRADKAGHAGTLDPLATGILPIALGEATKTVPYVMDGAKVYAFTVTWGEERSTDDLEGAIVATSANRPSAEQISEILPQFIGEIEQVPPQFSAIRIDGARAYDLAREGEKVEITPRMVEIARLDLVGQTDQNIASFEVECGKGTYVRSLARDFGRALGCYGYVSALRRREVSPFSQDDAVTQDVLEAASLQANAMLDAETNAAALPASAFAALDALMLSVESALEFLPRVDVSDEVAHRVRMGNPAIVRGRDAPAFADEAWAVNKGKLLAIGHIEHGSFHPRRVFK